MVVVRLREHAIKRDIHTLILVRAVIVQAVVMVIGEHLLRNAVAEQHLEVVIVVKPIVKLIPVVRDVIRT